MKLNFLTNVKNHLSFQDDSADRTETKDFGILDHIEKIVEISRKYGVDKCLNKGESHFDYVAKKLGISPLQAILFSHFMEESSDSRLSLYQIAGSIKCSKVRLIKYINECDELEKKKLIRCRRSDDEIFVRVPREVQNALRKNNEYTPEKRENLSVRALFMFFKRLFTERRNGELSCQALKEELIELIHANIHLTFCKKILSYNLGEIDMVLLVCFCHLFGNNHYDNIEFHDIEFIFDDDEIDIFNFGFKESAKEALSTGSHSLIEGKYIEYANSNGFVNTESYKLSDTAKKEMLSELSGLEKKNFAKNLILPDSIKPKKMFYNPREAESIQKLASLLRDEHYRKIQERLTSKGMRKGFACLFSGAPGTGKTETAYQIAKETGRSIMMVDISQTKSCWYGESEKKIKEIFDDYRTAADNSTAVPILLFNEADAIIGKRKAIGGKNQSIDQTENTIQNIILQEMENLSGILIATTNLSQNMDAAFERRFLYKITFEKPSIDIRQGIWSALLSGISADTIAELSGRFDLSGGQIENIARKIEVDAIISGGDFSVDTLIRYCKDELKDSLNAVKKIGFGNG